MSDHIVVGVVSKNKIIKGAQSRDEFNLKFEWILWCSSSNCKPLLEDSECLLDDVVQSCMTKVEQFLTVSKSYGAG